jgi:glycerophosphoryl diester phosphodiesterase
LGVHVTHGAVTKNPFLTGKTRPLVVGHRGVPLLHQENSLAGFRRAIALGIPAVELDVRLTADGVPVLFHDVLVDRLTGAAGSVAEMTWDQLSKLRLRRELPMGYDANGSVVNIRYAQAEPIARLDEVLAELRGKVAINVELKIALPRWWSASVGERTAHALAAAGVDGSVIVSSFDPRRLLAARRTHPPLLVSFCFDDTTLDFTRPLLHRFTRSHTPHRLLEHILGAHYVGKLFRTPAVGADHTLIGPGTVAALHARGVAIGTHTLFPIGSTTGKALSPKASTAAEVQRLVELGVDWIESDDPERLLALVA